jgi:hypothetical protein
MNTKLLALILLCSSTAYADDNPGIDYNGYNTTIYEKGVCFEKAGTQRCFPSVFHHLEKTDISMCQSQKMAIYKLKRRMEELSIANGRIACTNVGSGQSKVSV